MDSPLLIGFVFLVGLVFGSFGSVIVHRFPADKAINGRSQCPVCKHTLGVLDLFPVLSFVCLLGKCRHCGTRIPVRYPLTELLSACVITLPFLLYTEALVPPVLLAVALWALFLIALVDIDTQGIPDILSFPFVLMSAVYAVVSGGVSWAAPFVFAGFFFLQWAISRGKWVGSGDIILAVGLGFLLSSVQEVVIALGASYILGAVVAIVLIATKKRTRKDHLPFGPFLALGTVLVLVWGDALMALLAF